LAAAATEIAGIKVVSASVEGDGKILREMLDNLKSRLGDCAVLLATVSEGKVSLVAGVHGSALAKLKAGEMLSHVAGQIGGKGGGRADMAQGGGEDSSALAPALHSVNAWVRAKLA
jgi:alanyl-tRNA synthetase